MKEKAQHWVQAVRRWPFAVWCLLTTVAGGLYLSITLVAPLGGDDCINNLSKAVAVRQQPFWELLGEELAGIWNGLTLQEGRFFPFYFPFSRINWLFCGSVDSYRLYIIIYTLATAAVLALLIHRLTGSRRAALAFFALMPLMFCLWSEYSTNGMYCYEALPQATLLAAALAAHCMLSWAKTRHFRWAVGTALLTFISCGTYELGYVYIVPLGLFALMQHPKFWDAVKTGLPVLAGECVALLFYIGNSRVAAAGNELRYSGVTFSLDIPAILLTWVQQMSAGFPLNALLLGGAELGTPTAGDVFLSLLLAAVAAAALYMLRTKLSRKQLVLLFLAGLAILALPALLIALAAKYQEGDWVTWRNGYIPAVVESFGVGLMLLSAALAVFQLLRSARARCTAAVVLAAALALGGIYQRSSTRARYESRGLDYDIQVQSLQKGLLDAVPDDAVLLTNIDVWGASKAAQDLFVECYADRKIDTWLKTSWTPDQTDPDAPLYLFESYNNYGGYPVMWSGQVSDASLQTLETLTVYVAGDFIPDSAVLKYRVLDEDGSQVERAVNLSELPQSERTGSNGYFVTVDDENIVAEKIMIWAG